MGKQREEIYRELTPEGVGLCVAAGALAEGLTFVVMGIRLGSVPLPVLVFLYPLSITLIALTLLGRLWNHDPKVSKVVTGVTLLCAIPDLFKALPKGISGLPPISALVTGAERVLPFFSIGLGWFCPALISLAVVLIWRKYFNKE